MSWVKNDDRAHEHHKQREAGTAAYALWNAALGYCNHNLTDGRIRIAMVPDIWRPIGERFNYRRAAARLLENALWHAPSHACRSPLCPANPELSAQLETIQDAYFVHDYFEFQKSKREIMVEREKNANRQQRHRISKLNAAIAGLSDDGSNGVTDGVTGGVTNAVSNDTPVPVPGPVPVPMVGESIGPTLQEFADRIAKARIAVQLGSADRERFSRLYPVQTWEVDHAIAAAQKANVAKASYVLKVIENERERAAELSSRPAPPGPRPRRLSPKGQVIQAAIDADPNMFRVDKE